MSEIVASTGEQASSTPPITRSYSRYVFFVMFAISFLNYMDRYILSGSINVIAKELHFTIEDVGFISSAFLVVYTLSTLPLGLWADRAKRKDVVAICVTAWSLITALTALATNFTTLFLSRMLLGIGEAGYFPAGTALMSDYFRRSLRSRVLSWWSIAQVFGILFGATIGGLLAGLYVGSWRLGFLITGIPGLFFAWLAWRLREPRRNQADEEAASEYAGNVSPISSEEIDTPLVALKITPGIWAQIISLLRIKTVLVLIVMQIFAYFVLYVSLVFLSTYLQQTDIYAMSPALAGIYSGGVIALAGMLGTIAGGYLSDVRTLFNFAIRRGYLDLNAASGVELPALDGTAIIAIHSPEQVRQVLETARKWDIDVCRHLAVRYFAGVRSAEAHRLREDPAELLALLLGGGHWRGVRGHRGEARRDQRRDRPALHGTHAPQ